MKFHLFGIIVLWMLLEWTVEAQECGVLRDNQLYNEIATTEFNEFPWIARIYYINRLTNDRDYRCNAVLIGRRHLVAPAHCMFQARGFTPESVLLGDTNSANSDAEPDCNSDGFCSAIPKSHMISDIAVHPNYNRKTNVNDIAFIHLQTDVIFSEYIQPICLPPSYSYATDYLAQYFPFTGFLNKFENPTHSEKVKTIAHVISSELLSQIFRQNISSTTTICVSYVGEYSFLSGSALMGIDIANSKLKNFYLLGILSAGTYATRIQYVVLTRISAHANWIHSNLVQSLVNTDTRSIFS